MKTDINPYQSAVKIYYDGKLDYKATYLPVVKEDLKRRLFKFGNSFSDGMVKLYNK